MNVDELPEYTHPEPGTVEWWKENLRTQMCVAFKALGSTKPERLANTVISTLERQLELTNKAR